MSGNSLNGQRRRFSAETKWQAIQEARQGGVPVSQVCQKYDIRPGQFYQWEQTAERAALTALRGQTRGRRRVSPREEALLAEIERLRAVVAELSMENLSLKKGRWP